MEDKNKQKIPCSVGVLTFNNEKTLFRALESIKDFDDIIICDGGSVDATISVANSFNATILKQDPVYKFENNKIKNYAGVRNQTLEATKNDWFFFIDSDEYLSEELVDEIRQIVTSSQESPMAYWVPRKYVYGGVIIECASTYPNKQMRFFNKNGVTHFIKNVHERIEVSENTIVATLGSYMYVPMETDISRLRKKWAYYAELEICHIDTVTWSFIVRSLFQNIKISTLFTFRYIRNIFFCNGPRLPFMYEFERHVYHVQLIKSQLKRLLKE
jgi:glycosyltransferase involved in cell wall biosynthesis